MTAIWSWLSANRADLAILVTAVIGLITLFVILGQTILLRRQLTGAVYSKAKIGDLEFYLPALRKYPVEWLMCKQKEDEEVSLGKSLGERKLTGENLYVPVGYERELHIRWRFEKSQTLRSFRFGFLDKDAERRDCFNYKPKIIRVTRPYIKKLIGPSDEEEYSFLPRHIYEDWGGHYHCEYGFVRKLEQGRWFGRAITVRGERKGEYFLAVRIYVAEAPNPYEGHLKIKFE